MGGSAHEFAFRRAVGLALDELIDERRDLGVATGGLQRAQLEAQRGRVRACFLAQCAENAERLERVSLLQFHLGLQHQPRDREARHRRVGSREQRLGGRELPGGDGRASAEQCRQARGLRNAQRLLRELPGPAEAALQQRDDRRVLPGAGALLLLPLPVSSALPRAIRAHA